MIHGGNSSQLTLLPRNERIFRMGARMGCGFSFRGRGEMTGEWGRRDIRDRCYILVYILNGRGRYEDAGGNVFEIRPGCLYQRFPGILHSNIFQPDEDFFECYLILPPQIYELLLTSRTISLDRPCFEVGLNLAVYDWFDRIFQRLKTCPERDLHRELAEMHVFASELTALASREAKSKAFVEQASLLLEADLHLPCPLQSIARSLGVSYSKFRQDFQALSGIAPGEYRLRKRMELAQQLLAEQGAQIKNVARELGYPDVYSFSKQFKRYSGLTPGQFIQSRRLS